MVVDSEERGAGSDSIEGILSLPSALVRVSFSVLFSRSLFDAYHRFHRYQSTMHLASCATRFYYGLVHLPRAGRLETILRKKGGKYFLWDFPRQHDTPTCIQATTLDRIAINGPAHILRHRCPQNWERFSGSERRQTNPHAAAVGPCVPPSSDSCGHHGGPAPPFTMSLPPVRVRV